MNQDNIDEKMMTTNYTYPDTNDDDLQYKIYKKREFYYHRVPERNIMKTYNEVEEYRNLNCPKGSIDPREQQAILPNFINPNYKIVQNKDLIYVEDILNDELFLNLQNIFNNQKYKTNDNLFRKGNGVNFINLHKKKKYNNGSIYRINKYIRGRR